MERIYLASPHMSAEGYEQQYVQEAFDTNWIAPLDEVLFFVKGLEHLTEEKLKTEIIDYANSKSELNESKETERLSIINRPI